MARVLERRKVSAIKIFSRKPIGAGVSGGERSFKREVASVGIFDLKMRQGRKWFRSFDHGEFRSGLFVRDLVHVDDHVWHGSARLFWFRRGNIRGNGLSN